jgi:hypothetical protein
VRLDLGDQRVVQGHAGGLLGRTPVGGGEQRARCRFVEGVR